MWASRSGALSRRALVRGSLALPRTARAAEVLVADLVEVVVLAEEVLEVLVAEVVVGI